MERSTGGAKYSRITSLQYNNHSCTKGCEGEDIWGDVAKGCLHLRAKEPDCKISGGETIPFYTGRSDCSADTGPGVRCRLHWPLTPWHLVIQAWETERSESHPNPHGNGKMTADFFKNDFGLTARESAALLLGAHSFGTFNQQISQFKYDWTKNQASMLNNQLFRCSMDIKKSKFIIAQTLGMLPWGPSTSWPLLVAPLTPWWVTTSASQPPPGGGCLACSAGQVGGPSSGSTSITGPLNLC